MSGLIETGSALVTFLVYILGVFILAWISNRLLKTSTITLSKRASKTEDLDVVDSRSGMAYNGKVPLL